MPVDEEDISAKAWEDDAEYRRNEAERESQPRTPRKKEIIDRVREKPSRVREVPGKYEGAKPYNPPGRVERIREKLFPKKDASSQEYDRLNKKYKLNQREEDLRLRKKEADLDRLERKLNRQRQAETPGILGMGTAPVMGDMGGFGFGSMGGGFDHSFLGGAGGLDVSMTRGRGSGFSIGGIGLSIGRPGHGDPLTGLISPARKHGKKSRSHSKKKRR